MEQAEKCICICSCSGALQVKAPSFPIMQRAVASKGGVTVHFDPPINNGNAPVTGYHVTSIPEGMIKTGGQSPIRMKNAFTVGKWYSFVVRARNRRGLGPPSAESSFVHGFFYSLCVQGPRQDEGIPYVLVCVQLVFQCRTLPFCILVEERLCS